MFARVPNGWTVSTPFVAIIAAWLCITPSLLIAGQFSPSNLKVSAVATNEVRLTWVDNTKREMGFRITRSLLPTAEFRIVGEITRGNETFSDKTVQPNTTYYYKVRAYRSETRMTDWSEIVAVTTPNSQPSAEPPPDPGPAPVPPSDTTPPTVRLLEPSNGSVQNGMLTLTAEATDDVAVAQVEIYRDDHTRIAVTSSASCTASLDTKSLANGPHTFYAVAYDAANNLSMSSSATVTLNNPPPEAPTGLAAATVSASQINVTWQDNASNETAFRLERSTDPTFATASPLTLAADSTNYGDTGLVPNTTYYYRLQAVSSDWGDSAFAESANATTAAGSVLAVPDSLVATTVSTNQIALAWRDNSDNETGFRVERALSASGPWDVIATTGPGATSLASTGLAAGTTYYYRVAAFDATRVSEYSNVGVSSTQSAPSRLAAPSALSASGTSTNRIDVGWVDNSTNEAGFKVESAPSPSGPWTEKATVGAGVRTYSDSGLAANTARSYRVRATNATGDSDYSNIASATVLAAPGAAPVASGIYMLGKSSCGGDPLERISRCNKPFIDGIAARTGWRDYDRGISGPAYDFTIMDEGIRRMHAMGKKFAPLIRSQEVPEYVVRGAAETYFTTVPLKGDAVRRSETCVPWDQQSLVHYRNFLHALASHTIDGIPLRDHPALGPIRANVIGREHVGRENHEQVANIPGYTRAKYVKAVTDCLTAIRSEFPKTPIHAGYFSVKDNEPGKLDDVLIPAVASTGCGLFEELLTMDKPDNNGIYARNLLSGKARGSYIAFQALGAWMTHSPGNWTPGDNTPDNGITHGYRDFGARYYEIYGPDLENPSWEPMFRQWQSFFQSLP